MSSTTNSAEAPKGADTDAPEAMRVTRAEATESARALLRSRPHGVLGTMARHEDGGPFGSVAPYALDRTGAPIIYVAGIAEHTRNMKADPRVSLLVHAPEVTGQDIQTGARLCVLGVAAPVAESDAPDAWARYRARLPEARTYRETHDFSLWRIEPRRLRWIGGFGEIFWLRPEDFWIDPQQDALRDGAAGIVDHMNEDHRDAIEDFYAAELGVRPPDPRMVGVDAWGMDFEASVGRLRVEFLRPASPETVRLEVIAALRHARSRLPEPGAA